MAEHRREFIGVVPGGDGVDPSKETPAKRTYTPTRLGRLIRDRRLLASYSQAGLAELMGVPRETVKGWERGIIKMISPQDAIALVRVLPNTRMDELVEAMGYPLSTAEQVRRQQQQLQQELGVLNTIRKLVDRRHWGRPPKEERPVELDADADDDMD